MSPFKTTLTAVLALTALAATDAAADAIMIQNATVYTMTDDGVLENTDVFVSGNEIRKIGQDLPVPADIRVFDAEGKPLTPGLWGGAGAVGIVEVSAVEESSDASDETLEMRPEFDVTPAYNPNSSLIPVARTEGHTFTLLGAGGGGSIINGQGRVVALDGGYSSFHGGRVLFISLGGHAAEKAGGSRAGQWMQLNQAFAESGLKASDDGDGVLTRAGRSALANAVKSGTVVFGVNRASDILQTLSFARRHDIKAVINGGAEAWMVADELAAAGVPVMLDPLQNLPSSFDALGSRLDNAALLHEAGVTVIVDGAGSHNARKLRQMAGNAAANGLDHEAALAAITVNPAKVFGVSDKFGTLEEGKRADLVLWTGDPLEVTTVAERVIVNGKLDSMKSRQTELRDRYLAEDPALPRAYVR